MAKFVKETLDIDTLITGFREYRGMIYWTQMLAKIKAVRAGPFVKGYEISYQLFSPSGRVKLNATLPGGGPSR